MEMGGEQLSDHEISATLPFRVIFIHFCRVNFDLLWETTFLYSCLELFVDTGYVQGTEKMIMRGAFVEASSRRGGERVSGTGSGRMLCYGQIHVESCNDDDDLDNGNVNCDL